MGIYSNTRKTNSFLDVTGISLVRIVPLLILLMAGEAVQYIDPIFTKIENYSRLFRDVLHMTWDTVFHMFVGRSGMYFLKVHTE